MPSSPERLRGHYGAAHAPEQYGLDVVVRGRCFWGGGRESEEEHGVLRVDVEPLYAQRVKKEREIQYSLCWPQKKRGRESRF